MRASSKYAAFISYSHADKTWADWLHRSLEAYRVPGALIGGAAGVPTRLGRVFRDREELAAAHDLGDKIEAALRDSDALIVICSERAARSRWVNEEVLYWKRLGRAGRVFAIVVDGEPGDPARDCFPPALRYDLAADGTLSDVPAEPLAADARPEGDGRQLAKLKLLAGLLEVDFDQLRRRELESQRRAFRRFAAVAAALVLLFAGLAAMAGWFAYVSEAHRAEAERQRAQAERNLATAIDAAGQLALSIGVDVENTEGVQQTVLLRIQKLAQSLLNKLVEGQTLPRDAELTYAQSLLKSANAAIATSDPAAGWRDAKAALQIFMRLAAAEPSDPVSQRGMEIAHNLIGDLLEGEGKMDQALESYGEGLAIARTLSSATPSDERGLNDVWVAHMNIGRVKLSLPDLPGALASFQAAFAVSEALLSLDASSNEYRRTLAVSYASLGEVAKAKGDKAEALKDYDASLKVRQRIVAAEPNNAKYQRDLSVSFSQIGDLKLEQNDFDGARKSYEAGLEIARRLAASDTANTQYQRDLEICYDELGRAKVALEDQLGALGEFQSALEIARQLAERDPNNPELKRDLSVGYNEVGDMQLLLNKIDEALASYLAGLVLAEELVKAHAANDGYRHDLAVSHAKVGDALANQGKTVEAVGHYQQAIDILETLATDEASNPYADDIASLRHAIADMKARKR